ncbi:hypothetical protein E4U22_002244, partial [Claviceps purpurea]
MYLVHGLSVHASFRFAEVLRSETTKSILDNIIPEVFALDFESSKVLRKIIINNMRKRLALEPLAADVKKSLEQAMTDEGASGVFEIKEISDTLVRRMLDYIYTGNDEELSLEVPAEDVRSSSTELAKPGPDPKLTGSAYSPKTGSIYPSQIPDDKGRSCRIVPEVYAMEFKSCKLIRTTLIDFMRRRLMQRPLPAEVEESWEDATKNVPEFTRDLLKSFKDMPVLGH